MEYVVQAIQVLRHLVHAETNARYPKTGFSAISSRNYGPLGISLQFALVINATRNTYIGNNPSLVLLTYQDYIQLNDRVLYRGVSSCRKH